MAKRKVRDNQTGQIFEVDDAELGKYGLSTPTSTPMPSPTVTPPQPKTATVTPPQQANVGADVFNFISKLLIPNTKNTTEQYLSGKGPAPELQDILGLNLTSQSPFEKTKNKVGAELVSFGIPFGKGVGALQKILAPGAAVGALQGVSQDNATPQSVAGNALLGAGGAGAFGALGKLIGGASKLTGKGLSSTGENLAVRSLRPSPSQQLNFRKDTGEKIGDFLKKRNLEGADYEKIASRIQPLQNAFNELASTDLKIVNKDLLTGFDEVINKLGKSTLPEQKAKVNYLTEVRDTLKKQLKGKVSGADVVTSLRKEADDLIKNYNFDENTKGKLQLLRDIYQKTIRDAADREGIKIGNMSAKDAGIELSKYYKLLDVAEKQQFLGQGTSPFGIIDLLGGILGSSTGGGIPGVIGGVALTQLSKNPKVVGTASRTATSMGKKAASGADLLNNILQSSSQATGQASSRLATLLGLQPNSNNEQANYQSGISNALPERLTSQKVQRESNNIGQQLQDNYSQNNSQSNGQNQNIIPPDTSIAQDVNTQPQRRITAEQMQQVYVAQAQGLISTKTAEALQKAYDVQEKAIKSGQGKSSTPTEFDKKFDFAGRQAQEALRVLDENRIESGPLESLKSVIGETTGTQKKEITDFKSKLAVARTSARNALLGANMSDQEIKSLLDFVFDYNQPTPILRQRLQSFVESMNDYRANVAGGGVDAETLMQGLGQ